jgi:hypothetical protein
VKNTLFLFFSLVYLWAQASAKPNFKFINDYTPQKDIVERFADLKNPDFEKAVDAKDIQRVGADRIDWESTMAVAQIYDPILGFKNNPSTYGRKIARTKDRLVFDSTYSIDEFGRRFHAGEKKKNYNEFIALFGCSFTYGYALNDNETINYHLNTKKDFPFFTYNYAVAGSGTSHTLWLIKNSDFNKQIPEKKGVFIYVLMDQHMHRVTGAYPASDQQREMPYYEKNEKGELISLGSTKERRPIFSKIMFYTGKFFGNSILKNREFPARNKSYIKYFCDLLTEAKRHITSTYRDGRFVVYGHSYFPTDPDILSCLKNNNIEHFDGTKVENHPEYIIQGDGHPNDKWNKLIADDIYKYLAKGRL